MNNKKYTALFSLLLLGMGLSCTTDESLFPLPYNSRTVGGYLRMYRFTSNVFDVNNIANSAFETIFEPVDEKLGDNMLNIEFYASFKRGTGLTGEVPIKVIDNSGFVAPPAPTYSLYKRQLIRITASETLTALAAAPAVAPVEVIAGLWPSGSPFLAPPVSFIAADQIIYRWVMVMKDGRRITVVNAQKTNPPTEIAQNSPDIATGQFYLAPSQKTITVRQVIANSWVGTYGLKQMAIYSPNHTGLLHETAFPAYMNQKLFQNQLVTLAVPAGGLSTEREFTVNYRGSNVTMRVNLEQTAPGLTGASGTAALAALNAASSTVPPFGFGFTGATNANLGIAFVPLQNSSVSCTSKRQLYWITPGGGTFVGSAIMPAGLPLREIANRGVYRHDILGTVPGNVFSISIDDDCDEYGRGGGYCTWTRRVIVTLTKL